MNQRHHERLRASQASALPEPGPAASPAPVIAAQEAEYRNEGLDTPHAGLQTLAWAGERGDVETVKRSLCFEPEARVKAEALLAAMPENTRVQWKDVDSMAAALLTTHFMDSPFPSARILSHASVEAVGEDRVRMRLPGTPRDGTEFRREGAQWKYVITERQVDAYIASLQRKE